MYDCIISSHIVQAMVHVVIPHSDTSLILIHILIPSYYHIQKRHTIIINIINIIILLPAYTHLSGSAALVQRQPQPCTPVPHSVQLSLITIQAMVQMMMMMAQSKDDSVDQQAVLSAVQQDYLCWLVVRITGHHHETAQVTIRYLQSDMQITPVTTADSLKHTTGDM